MKVGIIGFGNIGRALAKGLIHTRSLNPESIYVTARTLATAQAVEALGVTQCENNATVVSACDVIVLAVKPAKVDDVTKELDACAIRGKVLISFVAGLSLMGLQSRLADEILIARAIPNVPIMNGTGLIGFTLAAGFSASTRKCVTDLLGAVGTPMEMEEVHLAGIGALAACGVAFVAVAIESFIDAGVKIGIPRDIATRAALQTFLGTSSVLMTERLHPAVLKDMVATPGGATIQGLCRLEELGLRASLISAISSAWSKMRDLS
jgi:pyrroline-5-carboxylate reductase